MKIFIIGIPQSGRTTVARSMCQEGFHYIDAVSWVKSLFRTPMPGEHPQQFNDDFHYWFTSRLNLKPDMIVDSIRDSMSAYGPEVREFVIDGISSPRDFATLFDYTKDFVVFLNRTDGDVETKDHENIGVSVIRDYCFWLSSAGLLPKHRWHEYNFKLSDKESDHIKALGSKNSVFIVKSLNKVMEHLKQSIKEYKREYDKVMVLSLQDQES